MHSNPVNHRSVFSALSFRVRIIRTLILRELKIQLRVSRLGFLLVLAEPMMQYAIMFTIFSFVGHRPAFGTSLGLFLATGLIPYFIFMHLASRTMGAVRSSKAFARVPTVTALDQAIARAVLEYLTLIFFALVLISVLVFLGLAPVPARPSELIAAVMAVGLAAFGVGLVNGVLSHMYRAYALAWAIVSRSMLFISGVFYVPASLPPMARDIVLWNPILHGLEWFRSGIFLSYSTTHLAKDYLLVWGVGSLTLGLVLLSVFSGRLLR